MKERFKTQTFTSTEFGEAYPQVEVIDNLSTKYPIAIGTLASENDQILCGITVAQAKGIISALFEAIDKVGGND